VILARREPRPPGMKKPSEMKKRRCAVCARSGAWAKPELKKFVRLCPVPRGRGVLVSQKSATASYGARAHWRLSACWPAVIVPGCKSPNTRLPTEVGLNGESETGIGASLLLAKQATRRRFGRWLGMARFEGYWPQVFPDDLQSGAHWRLNRRRPRDRSGTSGPLAARVLHPVNDSFPRSTPLSVQSAFIVNRVRG